jgi:hypothetical protein
MEVMNDESGVMKRNFAKHHGFVFSFAFVFSSLIIHHSSFVRAASGAAA